MGSISGALTQNYASGAQSDTTTTQAAKSDPLSGRQDFLQLLVAQLKHQDPLNPAQGTEFLSQLAQFSELEQMVGMRAELTAIRASVESSAVDTTKES